MDTQEHWSSFLLRKRMISWILRTDPDIKTGQILKACSTTIIITWDK